MRFQDMKEGWLIPWKNIWRPEPFLPYEQRNKFAIWRVHLNLFFNLSVSDLAIHPTYDWGCHMPIRFLKQFDSVSLTDDSLFPFFQIFLCADVGMIVWFW